MRMNDCDTYQGDVEEEANVHNNDILSEQLATAEMAYEKNNYSLCLDIYNSIVNNNSEGHYRVSPLLLTRCHLNIAAIEISKQKWKSCLEQCDIINNQFTEYLTEHQAIRTLYIKGISLLKLKDISNARKIVTDLFSQVRRCHVPPDEEELENYRELDLSLVQQEVYKYTEYLYEYIQACTYADYQAVSDLYRRDQSEVALQPYAQYLLLCRAQVYVYCGQINKVREIIKILYTIRWEGLYYYCVLGRGAISKGVCTPFVNGIAKGSPVSH